LIKNFALQFLQCHTHEVKLQISNRNLRINSSTNSKAEIVPGILLAFNIPQLALPLFPISRSHHFAIRGLTLAAKYHCSKFPQLLSSPSILSPTVPRASGFIVKVKAKYF